MKHKIVYTCGLYLKANSFYFQDRPIIFKDSDAMDLKIRNLA